MDAETALERLVEESQQRALAIARMEEAVAEMRREVASLARILRDGNGTPSIVVRMALVEKAAGESATEITSLRASLEARIQEDVRRRWQIACAVGAGIVSLFGVFFSALVKGLGR